MTKIFTLDDVVQYFRVSPPTVKRWLGLTRSGRGDFPLPVSPKGCRLLWNREDIENWRSQLGNEAPLLEQLPETPTERRRQNNQVAKKLAGLGVAINKKGNA